MKALYVCVALVAFQLASAQKTQELKDFKSVAVKGDIELKLVKSNENKVVYESEDEDGIEISQDNNDLALGGEGTVTLYYKNDLEAIAAGADTQVSGDDEIKGKSFNLAAAADSEIHLKLNVQSLKVAAASDAEVTLNGKTGELNVTIGSDAQLQAQDLKAENATVTIGSDGEAVIYATGIVNATVGSDAQLTIYGKPKKVNEVKGSDSEITIAE